MRIGRFIIDICPLWSNHMTGIAACYYGFVLAGDTQSIVIFFFPFQFGWYFGDMRDIRT